MASLECFSLIRRTLPSLFVHSTVTRLVSHEHQVFIDVRGLLDVSPTGRFPGPFSYPKHCERQLSNTEDIRRRGRDSGNALEAVDAVRS